MAYGPVIAFERNFLYAFVIVTSQSHFRPPPKNEVSNRFALRRINFDSFFCMLGELLNMPELVC